MYSTKFSRIISCLIIVCIMLAFNALAEQNKTVSDIGFYLGNIIVLYSDGTIDVAKGSNGTSTMKQWKDVSTIKVSESGILAITRDGNVHMWGGYDIKYELGEEWTDIVLGAAGYTHAVGLKSDGTWVSAGDYRNGECDIDNWTDIVDIQVGKNYTIGLKSDGTVVATGKNNVGQCNVSSWTDIVKIAAGEKHTVGLCSDGTVVATGSDDYDQCLVGRWKNVKDIAADSSITIGLTNDGKILITDNHHNAMNGYGKDRKIPGQFDHASRLVADSLNIAVINDNGTIEVYGDNMGGACDYFGNASPDKNNSEPKVYTKKECEEIALNYMKEHIAKYLKNPSSLQINEITGYEADNQQYIFDIDFSAMNSFGGYDRKSYYCFVDYTTGKVTDGGMV